VIAAALILADGDVAVGGWVVLQPHDDQGQHEEADAHVEQQVDDYTHRCSQTAT
jgi:hypothetical protein